MIGATCPKCDYIHASGDVIAVGKFAPSGPIGFKVADGDDTIYPTRTDAEAALCAARQRRRHRPAPRLAERSTQPALFAVAAPVEKPAPFPAATMEEAARAKAWCDFLGQVNLSLLVWDIDPAVRSECEPVLSWLRRCRDDLLAWLPACEHAASVVNGGGS